MFFVFFFLKDLGYAQGATHLIKGQEWNTVLNILIVSFAGSFIMMGAGINNIGSTVMIADVVDYGEWKTGSRNDSVIFSIQTLITKFAAAIATVILGIGITVSRLPSMKQSVDAAGNIIYSFSGAVTNQMLVIFRGVMFITPIPLMIIGYISYKRKYRLFGDYYEKIRADIKERRAAKAEILKSDDEKVKTTKELP